jgi:peroxiredoxin Q/BCP
MKIGTGFLLALAVCSLAGCAHRVAMQPIKVEPVRMTLDINVTVERQEIENASAELSPVMGNAAPDFTLPDQNNRPVTLSKFRGKWVVLYFYPKNNTFGCTMEAVEFTKLLPNFEALNATVIGVSEDTIDSHCDFIAEHQLKLTLLSDPEHRVMKLYGAWVISLLGDMQYGRAVRTTLIIDPRGVIRHFIPEVMPQGHAKRILTKLASLQGVPE